MTTTALQAATKIVCQAQEMAQHYPGWAVEYATGLLTEAPGNLIDANDDEFEADRFSYHLMGAVTQHQHGNEPISEMTLHQFLAMLDTLVLRIKADMAEE